MVDKSYLLKQETIRRLEKAVDQVNQTRTGPGPSRSPNERMPAVVLARITAVYDQNAAGAKWSSLDANLAVPLYAAEEVIPERATGKFKHPRGSRVWGDDSDPESLPPIMQYYGASLLTERRERTGYA